MVLSRSLVLVALVLQGTWLVAQVGPGRKAVREDFQRYWDAVRHKDVQAQLDALDPRMFELVPRERLKDGLERSAQDTAVRVETGPATAIRVSGPFRTTDRAFAGVVFHYVMRLTLAADPDTDVGRKDAFLLEMLGRQYGPDQVHIDAADGAFVIHAERRLVAVQEAGQVRWRFLEHGKDMQGAYTELVPVDMLARLFH